MEWVLSSRVGGMRLGVESLVVASDAVVVARSLLVKVMGAAELVCTPALKARARPLRLRLSTGLLLLGLTP